MCAAYFSKTPLRKRYQARPQLMETQVNATPLLTLLTPDALLGPMVQLCLLATGMCLILGWRRPIAGLGAIAASLLVVPLMDPLLSALVEMIPLWLLALILLVLTLQVCGLVVGMFIGKRAADHMMGELAASAVVSFLRLPYVLACRLVCPLLKGGWTLVLGLYRSLLGPGP